MTLPTRSGTPFGCRRLLGHVVKPAARAAGIPELTFHDLRHTGASLMIAADRHVNVIAERMGHPAGGALVLPRYGDLYEGARRQAATAPEAHSSGQAASLWWDGRGMQGGSGSESMGSESLTTREIPLVLRERGSASGRPFARGRWPATTYRWAAISARSPERGDLPGVGALAGLRPLRPGGDATVGVRPWQVALLGQGAVAGGRRDACHRVPRGRRRLTRHGAAARFA